MALTDDDVIDEALAAWRTYEQETTIDRAREDAAELERRAARAGDTLRALLALDDDAPLPELEHNDDGTISVHLGRLHLVGRFRDAEWDDGPRWHLVRPCPDCGKPAPTVEHYTYLAWLGRALDPERPPPALDEHDGCSASESIYGSWQVREANNANQLAKILNEWERSHTQPRVVPCGSRVLVYAESHDDGDAF